MVLSGCAATTAVDSGQTTVTAPAKIYTLHEPAAINGVTVTVLSAGAYTATDELVPLGAGKKYYAVEVQIKNDSDKKITYNMLDFTLRDANRVAVSPSVTQKDPALHSGELATGGQVTGDITFAIPDQWQNPELVYHAVWWDGSQLFFKLY